MAGLQRSATTFRRSGSSGLVWDERFLTEADAEAKASDGAAEDPQPELRHSRSVGSIGMLRRGGGDSDNKKARAKEKKQKQGHKEEARSNQQQVFRTKDVAPDVDPPSPRVSGCILCAIFGGSSGSTGKARRRSKSKPRKK
ncbi:hypothetical protein BDA96_10G241100 [Sorghum bicolor]|jgi:hypothetical protein|uniref:Uncharacterized protein n=2 Tax=Sorghum bicolor TaxID=4558 RepID=A0A921Q6Y6_SORBI|nr:uncharacterized protein At1g15400 [Sorghum bicolor]EER88608.1 hypothetical protein SORBI_3010G183500 [Sorghum bicolor]KAG0515001.1 hypothetical protein BDA96_10G241100 [Sorghum bicolor]|eukprot:XP_002437241.1 uncharacterized protein At1g15400 [Sorghum bicolor]